MLIVLRCCVFFALLPRLSTAQTITETFGIGANGFSIEFVQIGNPGNEPDTTGNPNPAGSVSYVYNIGKYEISRDIIDKANLAGALGITMYDMTSEYGGNGALKPATGISWYEAAKFVNYINTSSGNTAAYKFDGSGNFQVWSSGDAGFNPSNVYRNSLAKYFLPSSAEWYKAAFSSPSGGYYNFATGSDSVPNPVAGGTNSNTLVSSDPDNTLIGPANVDNAGGLSAWGTMAQGGNAMEWTETAVDGINDSAGENKELRGGAWYMVAGSTGADTRLTVSKPSYEYAFSGFRIAMVPAPPRSSRRTARASRRTAPWKILRYPPPAPLSRTCPRKTAEWSGHPSHR